MTTELWRPIPGMRDYEVSSLGRVRSYRAHGGKKRLRDPYLKTVRPNGRGYLSVVLQVHPGRSQAYCVHALVAAAFLGARPEGQQVAHADGNRLNARLDNLRYATPLENAQDKHRHGTTCRGESDGNSKLTEAQVGEIRERYRAGELQVRLAESFGISQSQISNIARVASWAYLETAVAR